jgi:hypothetical protein
LGDVVVDALSAGAIDGRAAALKRRFGCSRQ